MFRDGEEIGRNQQVFSVEPGKFGYRLVPDARGHGYATEAGRAVLAIAAESFHGELLAMIDRQNLASKRVIGKLGFAFWKVAADPDGYHVEFYRRSFC